MILLLLFLLTMPVCAMTAGVMVWAIYRNEALEDGPLVRSFLFFMLLAVSLVWGASRTNAVRLRVDPVFRMQTDIEAQPLYATLARLAPDDAESLRVALATHMARGETISQALVEARPTLTGLAVHRLGFSDQDSHLAWARLVVSSLKELRAQDPALCYRAIQANNSNLEDSRLFSSENSAEFQRTVIQVYESADRGMRREWPPDDKPVEFNEAAREFRVIQDSIEQRFGRSIAAQVASGKFPDEPEDTPDELCRARLFQLESMLKRPKAMASRLLDSVLRR